MDSVTRHFGLKKEFSGFLLVFDSHPWAMLSYTHMEVQTPRKVEKICSLTVKCNISKKQAKEEVTRGYHVIAPNKKKRKQLIMSHEKRGTTR